MAFCDDSNLILAGPQAVAALQRNIAGSLSRILRPCALQTLMNRVQAGKGRTSCEGVDQFPARRD